jgi:redox-sensitive bicupin YhaK (pirin superfamily)
VRVFSDVTAGHAVMFGDRTMLTIRKSAERGVTRFGGWLDSRHSFSFGDYHDPRHHQFHALRVINDDRVAPGGGFPTHPHRDMEILTWVLTGSLEHRDSMGHGEVIHAGEWQAMSAGTGITHSEFNPSQTEEVHLLQIWLLPDRRGLKPGYAQRSFPDTDTNGRWRLVAAADGTDGSLLIHQDARVFVTRLTRGQSAGLGLGSGERAAYLHVATGRVTANGVALSAGDALAIEGESHLTVVGEEESQAVLFDLA